MDKREYITSGGGTVLTITGLAVDSLQGEGMCASFPVPPEGRAGEGRRGVACASP